VTHPPAVHLAMQNSSFALHAVRLARQCNSVLYVHFGAPCSTLVAVVRFAGDSGPEVPRTCEVQMALECRSDGLRAMALVCFYFFCCPWFCCFDWRNFDAFCTAMKVHSFMDRIAVHCIVRRSSLCTKIVQRSSLIIIFGGIFLQICMDIDAVY
jgi:hypothetical protein